MALQIGIVGLPNVGKSTLFNALTHAHALVANYPFTTIDPNVGVAEIPDPRLSQIAGVIHPKRQVPASIEFVDIAGLVKGAASGEGLGNQFLGHIRNVDAIALVLRCFENVDIPHQFDSVDPLLDLDTLNLELTLADIVTLERRLDKVHGAAKANPREFVHQIEYLEKLKAHLNSGRRAALFPGSAQERVWRDEMGLLSDKPQLLVANVNEADLPDGGRLAQPVLERAAGEGHHAVVLCARLEAELTEMSPADAEEYRAGLGLGDSGLTRMAAAGYELLKLITFFTATGTDEVRAWPLRAGHTVWEAAGLIHTDMQKGFIRAEVIPWDELLRVGSWAHAREIGHVRIEGRDTVVKDGDVIHIRFNV